MKAQPISRWGEGPNRPNQKLWGQKIENSQSDGIAANHSRKRLVKKQCRLGSNRTRGGCHAKTR
jgi:hypothetical protein